MTPVVVLCHWDGWIEVYGKDIDARVIMVPDIKGPVLTIDDPAGEIAAERYVEAVLPPPHRKVYMPGFLQQTANLECLKPRDIARRRTMVDLLRAIDQLAAQLEEKAA